MKVQTRIIAIYEHRSHPQYPEDNFNQKRVISNERELFDLMIECYRRHLWNSTGVPNEHCMEWLNFYFEEERFIVVDDEVFVNQKRTECSKPEYFDSAKQKAIELMRRAFNTLTNWKMMRWEKENEEKERRRYLELKSKFENEASGN